MVLGLDHNLKTVCCSIYCNIFEVVENFSSDVIVHGGHCRLHVSAKSTTMDAAIVAYCCLHLARFLQLNISCISFFIIVIYPSGSIVTLLFIFFLYFYRVNNLLEIFYRQVRFRVPGLQLFYGFTDLVPAVAGMFTDGLGHKQNSPSRPSSNPGIGVFCLVTGHLLILSSSMDSFSSSWRLPVEFS